MVVINVISKLGPKIENWRGKINSEFIKTLEEDGLEYDSGKVWVDFKAEDFKSKGIYVSESLQVTRGRIIITKNRFIAIVSGYKLIDVPKDHPWFRKIVINDSKPERYKIELDLKKFETGFEGLIYLNFHIRAKTIKEWL
jgi:hypothetical protein